MTFVLWYLTLKRRRIRYVLPCMYDISLWVYMTVQNVKCIWRYDIQKTMRYYSYKGRFHPKFIIVHSKLMDSIILGGVLMDSMRTPWGLHRDSTRTPWTLWVESSWTPWGLHGDSMGTPQDFEGIIMTFEQVMQSPWGVHGNMWATVKYRYRWPGSAGQVPVKIQVLVI